MAGQIINKWLIRELSHGLKQRLRPVLGLMLGLVISGALTSCKSQPAAPVVSASPGVTVTGEAIPAQLQEMIDTWNDPAIQKVQAFQIFDNLYYVGIDWVAAYVLQTSAGLILIDALYEPWVEHLLTGMDELGLDPNDIKYVIVTHGHFDHAGGAAQINRRFGATVVMTEEDWALAREPASIPAFAMDVPATGQVAHDGEIIQLGDTEVELFKTPGHTEGVLSLRYPVHDGTQTYTAITLGGVGLNFSGVERTQSYLDSYARLRTEIAKDASVSLPNHAEMGAVFERAKQLAQRAPGAPHPFVDPEGFAADLAGFVAAAENKLNAEKSGTAQDPLDALKSVLTGQESEQETTDQ